MLACFIGFGLIKGVSPLLHTPLMSLTNALDAIVVVAAIVTAGRHKSTLTGWEQSPFGASSNVVGGFFITDRMLKMFKSPGRNNNERVAASAVSRFRLPCRSRLFILSLKWMSSPTTARSGIWAGEIGMALAVAGTLFNPDIVEYKWIVVPLIIGAGIGVPLGMVHMTAVPQRTALSHAFGALSAALIGIAEYYVGTAQVTRFRNGRDRAGSNYRVAHVYRQRDGGRKAAGNTAAAAHRL